VDGTSDDGADDLDDPAEYDDQVDRSPKGSTLARLLVQADQANKQPKI
jgi:hypothetical protein